MYKAFDLQSRVEVAVKLFKKDFASDRYTQEAFARESRSLQALDHPNIVKVFDGGRERDGGKQYLVLEWLENGLTDFIESHPLGGWDDFYELVGQPILNGLTHAFARQIVHRDVKPQNILVAGDSTLKISDFGISKYKGSIQPGVTLAGFRSEPYCPPERSEGVYSDTRDVYSFAVLALACLEGFDLLTYDDVYRVLDRVDVPATVRRVLDLSLHRDPSQRPGNIPILAEELERIHARRQSAWVHKRCCFVRCAGDKALAAVERDYPHLDQNGLSRVFLDDTAEECWLLLDHTANSREQRFKLIGQRYVYYMAIDQRTHDHLVITRSASPSPGLIDRLRLDAWRPPIEMKLRQSSPGADGHKVVEWLVSSLIDFGEQVAARRAIERQERLFVLCEHLLNAGDTVQRARHRRLRFDKGTVDGSRITLDLASTPEEEIIGQPWYIRLPDGYVVAGEIESVGERRAVLWTDGPIQVDLPKTGELRFDIRASRKALQRQRAALDSVRFERCVRPHLKRLLADPSRAATPVPIQVGDYFQPALDDDKKNAVASALGAEEFLLVEGPPGTGKTRLIIEIILQTLRREPWSRILLSSQTHIALDNAIEGLLKLAPELMTVRIGHRQDPRVAESVRGLLLESQAESWLGRVRQASIAFLEKWAADHRVDPSEVRLGMAVSRLKVALLEEARLNRQVLEDETNAANLRDVLAKRDITGDGTAYQELSELVRQHEEHLEASRHDLVNARARAKEARTTLAQSHELGAELLSLGPEELAEWEEDLIDRSADTRQLRSFVELAEEWELRFGKSSDFYGAVLVDAQVVAGTCVGFIGAKGIQDIDFDLCIVDEASKATITELLVPLSRARRWIVVGDPQQLPPFEDNTAEWLSGLKEQGISRTEATQTLLDHLGDSLPEPNCAVLTTQHRMRHAIGELVSHCFYDGRLVSVRGDDGYQLRLVIPTPVTWVSTARLPNRFEVRAKPSFKNLCEVRESVALIRRINTLAKSLQQQYSIALLTGYIAQRVECERALARLRGELTNVTTAITTVDAYQGREADICIYSVTRCNKDGKIGFLKERRRLNVALSRGKEALVIVGDHVFCRSIAGQNPFDDVLQHILRHPSECTVHEVAP